MLLMARISRTCVFWNDRIDLASDTIYEYGKQRENTTRDN